MPGMGSGGSDTNNPAIVSAFHHALLHQGLIVLLILGLVWVAWNVLRSRQLRLARLGSSLPAGTATLASQPEPAARRLLRVSFGLLWIFDGVLQGQSSMPLGMVPQVIKRAAATSPQWVQDLDNFAGRIWAYHPVSAAAAVVWVQVGIGLWLLAAPRGAWSRCGGLVTTAWGFIVWAFGEAFGGIFAPGVTWLFGPPGAVLFYCVAGALIALPERTWASRRFADLLVRLIGAFFLAGAVIQAWPGRGFWQGQPDPHATPGTLTSMVQQMAQTPQPHLLSAWVAAFADFDAAHGWAVNLTAVIALAAIGASFMTARPRMVRVGLVSGVVLCLADWVLVQDLGFMGGVGTDPNSMIPLIVLLGAGYLSISKSPAASQETDQLELASGESWSWRDRLAFVPSYVFRLVAVLAAAGIVLIGAAPLALAATEPQADPILAKAFNHTPQATSFPAPNFHLIDQYGRPVSLATLSGKTVALTFLDDVCVTQCPLIAQYMKAADALLGTDSRRVEFVAINSNPRYIEPEYLQAFDQNEGLDRVPNWLYLTGISLPQLQQAWHALGDTVELMPGGSMDMHSMFAYVIDSNGRVRYILNTDPDPGTEATQSSFAVILADSIKRVISSK